MAEDGEEEEAAIAYYAAVVRRRQCLEAAGEVCYMAHRAKRDGEPGIDSALRSGVLGAVHPDVVEGWLRESALGV